MVMHQSFCTCPRCARARKARKIGIGVGLGIAAVVVLAIVSQPAVLNQFRSLSGSFDNVLQDKTEESGKQGTGQSQPIITTTGPDGIRTTGGPQFDLSEGKEVSLRDQVAQQNYDTDLIARLVHDKVNEFRSFQKVQQLSFDRELSEIAYAHSKDMSERDYFEHDNPDGEDPTARAEEEGYLCSKSTHVGIGENILTSYAYGSYTTTSFGTTTYDWRTNEKIAEDIFQGWYDSIPHRLNMYDYKYDREGIGIYIDEYARVFATQDFC